VRILLISAYEASSHKAWADALMSNLPEHDWTYMALPPRHFAWRIRGNAMSFAFDPKFKPLLEKPYDLIMATSMTDCVGLKAFCPDLQNIPWLLYFHENQFAYPASDKQQGLVEMQMVTLYSALAADQCVFNSQFNKDSFFSGARALLKKLPDYVSPDWLSVSEEKACVVPVPVSVPTLMTKPQIDKRKGQAPMRLVWSARWEYDKGPDRLLAILQELSARHVPFEIAILGEQFRSIPKEFEQIKQAFSAQISQFGFAKNRQDYLDCLASADIVLSTALHEFQGLAVLEAVALGCVPVLPNRQVYPELFGDEFLYHSDLHDPEKEAQSAVDLMIKLATESAEAPSVVPFELSALLPLYAAQIRQSAGR
jgi:glycosyltransferase involved in cell wall biosynthesis